MTDARTPSDSSPRRRPWALWLWAAGLCVVLLSMCAAPLLSGADDPSLAGGQLDGELTSELVAPPEVATPAPPPSPAATEEADPEPEPEARAVIEQDDEDLQPSEESDDEPDEVEEGDDRSSADPSEDESPSESFLEPSLPDEPDADDVPEEAPDLVRSAIRLDGDQADQAQLDAVREAEGVTDATGISVGTVTAPAPDGELELTFAGVQVDEFRAFTPEVSAERQDLWQRMVEGDAAFTHHRGYELELMLGGWFSPDGSHIDDEPVNQFSIAAAGNIDIADPSEGEAAPEPDDPQAVRVGAFASNGVPPVADVMVSAETAADIGIDDHAAILVAVDDSADIEALADTLAEQTGFAAEIIPEPVPQTGDSPAMPEQPEDSEDPEDVPEEQPVPPPGDDEIVAFDYIDNGDGTIQIDQDWVNQYIVTEHLPIFEGNATCHRVMMPRLIGALEEVEDSGLAHLIDPNDYGGCWVARHIDWNPSRPLSMHAWGLAVDFNVQTNQLGAEPQMDRRIVEIFERWGFSWGGYWNRPDGMHFEYGNPPG